MVKGKAFVVVGHSHWGKSRTLRELTNSKRKAWIQLNGFRIFVRRMSNDDIAKGLRDFLRDIDNNDKDIIIITLCPSFDKPERKTKEILELLRNKYTPYFFILKRKYKGHGEILESEINELSSIGRVEILDGKIDDTERAKHLRRYIKRYL